MKVLTPRYSKEEFARRGDEIYDRDIKPHVTAEDDGKFVVIDIETGDYEMDRDELVAHDRLSLRILMRKFGSRELDRGTRATFAFGTVRRQHERAKPCHR